MLPARDMLDLLARFGDPRPYLRPDGTIAPSWELKILTTIHLPAPLRLGWLPPGMSEAPLVWRIRCNRGIAADLSLVYHAIYDEDLWPLLKTFDGCYAWRRQRGSLTRPSMHSWGLAVDHNAFEDPQGDPVIDMDSRIVGVFKRYGFRWGGDWKMPRTDAMHFDAADERSGL